ncbi:MAG: ABC transporter permease [Actinomycetota bacterium]|nr:ABC transporter permease [Actinomycetota bacterium]
MAAADQGDRSRRRGGLVPYALLTPGVLWLALFFLVPMFTLFRTALSVKESRFDLEPTFSWRWANFTESISTYSSQFTRSFLYAGAATVLCIAIGYPIAYVIAVRGGRWRNVLLGLVVIPFFTSYLIRTLAWQTVLNDDGPVLSLLDAVNLLGPLDQIGLVQNGRLLATNVAVIGGLTYNFLPFMILPIYVSLEKIDLRLLDAARDLYANGWQGFRRVTLPLTLPGVFAGTLLTFIPAAGDFVNAKFLGGPNQTMIGTGVQDRFLVQLDYPTAAALSFVLMAIITAGVLLYARLLGTEDLI